MQVAELEKALLGLRFRSRAWTAIDGRGASHTSAAVACLDSRDRPSIVTRESLAPVFNILRPDRRPRRVGLYRRFSGCRAGRRPIIADFVWTTARARHQRHVNGLCLA